MRQSCADTSDVSDELINSFKLPGGADNVSKYKSGEISARQLAVEVAADLKADIAIDVVASAFAAAPIPHIKGLGIILGKAALSFPRYYAKSKAAINSLSLLSKTIQEAERVISSRQGGNSGGPNLEPEEPEKKKDKHRVKRTAEDVIKYFKELKKDKNWQFYRTDGRGHRAYRNRKTGEIRYNDDTHHEIECFDKHGNHTVRDAVTDAVLNKPKHPMPDWLK